MPRMLNDKLCEVTFQDRISDCNLTVFYRMPATAERIAYANALVIRKRGKVKNQTGEAHNKYGLLILKGIKDGDFITDDNKPLSSDPKSPDYNPAWKAIIERYASDVVALLCSHVFDVSVVADALDIDEDEDPPDGDSPEGKDKDPL